MISLAGNRTRGSAVKTRDVNHYTTRDCLVMVRRHLMQITVLSCPEAVKPSTSFHKQHQALEPTHVNSVFFLSLRQHEFFLMTARISR